MSEVLLSRNELYDLVWSEPMLRLSKKYVISDVGLRKICIGMDIPLPRAGHWMKLQAGKKVDQPKLPSNYSGKTVVKLELREEGKEYYTGKHADVKKLKDDIVKDVGYIIHIPERLNTKELLILAAKESLGRKIEMWNYKGIIQTEANIIDIKVSEANVRRALIFMDCFIKMLRLRGHNIIVNSKGTYAVIDKEEIKIAFRERCKKVIVKKYSWDTTEFHANGLLYFKAEGYYCKEWPDGKILIEQQIPNILAKLELEVKELHKIQEQNRIYFAKLEKEKQELREIEARKEKELNDFKSLIDDAARWHKVEMLRNYLEAIEKEGQKGKLSEEEFSNWLLWAKKKLDWYDPHIEESDDLLSDVDRNTLIKKTKKDY